MEGIVDTFVSSTAKSIRDAPVLLVPEYAVSDGEAEEHLLEVVEDLFDKIEQCLTRCGIVKSSIDSTRGKVGNGMPKLAFKSIDALGSGFVDFSSSSDEDSEDLIVEEEVVVEEQDSIVDKDLGNSVTDKIPPKSLLDSDDDGEDDQEMDEDDTFVKGKRIVHDSSEESDDDDSAIDTDTNDAESEMNDIDIENQLGNDNTNIATTDSSDGIDANNTSMRNVNHYNQDSKSNNAVREYVTNEFIDDEADDEDDEGGDEEEEYQTNTDLDALERMIDHNEYHDDLEIDHGAQIERELLEVANDPLLQRIKERYLQAKQDQDMQNQANNSKNHPPKPRKRLEQAADKMLKYVSSLQVDTQLQGEEQDSDEDTEVCSLKKKKARAQWAMRKREYTSTTTRSELKGGIIQTNLTRHKVSYSRAPAPKKIKTFAHHSMSSGSYLQKSTPEKTRLFSSKAMSGTAAQNVQKCWIFGSSGSTSVHTDKQPKPSLSQSSTPSKARPKPSPSPTQTPSKRGKSRGILLDLLSTRKE